MSSGNSLVLRLVKKIVLKRMYKKHVVSNSFIKDDIVQTFKVRGCRNQTNSIEGQFYHLMTYYPEFAFIFFWRIRKRHYRWAYLFTEQFASKIFSSTQIEGGLMCYHPFGTVINAKSIGKNFQFRNGLTIGNKGNDNRLLPTIGHDVTVGPNVIIIGDITIGDHVVVGAGAVVVKDVPSYSVVAGNPAKVIKTITPIP